MTTETITSLALNLLVKSPENVRKTHPDAGHAALKASIIADGLLQNLVVYPLESGKFAVAGGERRRQALACAATIWVVLSDDHDGRRGGRPEGGRSPTVG